MDIAIRPAQPSDADAVAALTHQLGYEVSVAEASARLSRILAKDDHHFLIADVDGRRVGWLHASISQHIDTDPCVIIEGLVIDRDHRGRGVGKALLSRQSASVLRASRIHERQDAILVRQRSRCGGTGRGHAAGSAR